MKAAFLALMTLAIATFAADARAEIPWQTNLRTAHAQAEAQGKLLLLHFYSDNCSWCDKLEAGAFKTPTVQQAISQGFVPVKIHANSSPKLAEMFKVTKFPSDVVVTVDGKTLAHGVSPQEPARYVSMLASTIPRPGAPDTSAIAATQNTATQNTAPQNTAPPTAKQMTAPAVPSYAAAPTPTSPTPSSPAPSSPAPSSPAPTANLPRTTGADLVMQAEKENSFVLPNNPGSPNPVTAKLASGREDSAPKAETAAFAMPDAPVTKTLSSQVSAPEPKASSKPTAVATASPAPATAPSATPELAMDGYCAVTVIEEAKWVEGNPKFGVIHLGKLYLFASEDKMQKFLAEPIPYTPVLNEIDVVRFFEERVIVPGKREWAMQDPFNKRMFFFADKAAMLHFENTYERYVDAAIEVMDKAVAESNP